MRVAVAGATGVLGRDALPALAAAGHEVRGFSRSATGGDETLIAMDVLDREAVVSFAAEWRPEVIVHFATAIPAQLKPWGVERQFEPTSRLRTEGTRNLIAAAEAAGGARLIAQSVAFAVEPGPGLADESVPIASRTISALGRTGDAIAELEQLTLDADGTVLRFGQLVGPGTIFAADGSMGQPASRGMLPVVHSGGRESTFSFTHPRDAASALVAALAHPGATGVFNVVDDDPAPGSVWVPELSRALGAKRAPRRAPAWLVKPLLGSYGVRFMTELRGSSNDRAKAELGWVPTHPWRDAFAVSACERGRGPSPTNPM
ncbi:MAG: NAD(P)-dependent oxidoreductase [Solirubrobacterales bacterium]